MRAGRSGESEGTRSGCDFKACLRRWSAAYRDNEIYNGHTSCRHRGLAVE